MKSLANGCVCSLTRGIQLGTSNSYFSLQTILRSENLALPDLHLDFVVNSERQDIFTVKWYGINGFTTDLKNRLIPRIIGPEQE